MKLGEGKDCFRNFSQDSLTHMASHVMHGTQRDIFFAHYDTRRLDCARSYGKSCRPFGPGISRGARSSWRPGSNTSAFEYGYHLI